MWHLIPSYHPHPWVHLLLTHEGPSAWTAGQSDFGQYLVIDLGEKMNITSISTQGKPYTSEYVQEFRIEFGYDGQDFAPYRDKFGNFKVGRENSGYISVKKKQSSILSYIPWEFGVSPISPPLP